MEFGHTSFSKTNQFIRSMVQTIKMEIQGKQTTTFLDGIYNYIDKDAEIMQPPDKYQIIIYRDILIKFNVR